MKYTVAAAAVAFAGVTAAQGGIPECALPCLTTAVTKLGCTGLDDAACACTPENQAALFADTEMISCLRSSCTDPADLENAVSAGLAICADAGADDGEGEEEGEATATETGDEAEATGTATATDDGAEATATETGDEEAEATETSDETEATETEATKTEPADETEATDTTESSTVPGSGASTNAFFSAAAFFVAVLAF